LRQGGFFWKKKKNERGVLLEKEEKRKHGVFKVGSVGRVSFLFC